MIEGMRPATLRSTLAGLLLCALLPTGVEAWPAHGSVPFEPAVTVAIQPLGGMDRALLESVAADVEQAFGVQVVMLPAKLLPRSAFYAARARYRGERLLEWLEAEKPAGADKILGVMSADLSVTKGQVYDWGVMGVAGLGKAAGVVSIHRLRSRNLATRTRQVSVHELGHTFGLSHCPSPQCIMNDAEGGVRAVDESSGHFCDGCQLKLQDALRQ